MFRGAHEQHVLENVSGLLAVIGEIPRAHLHHHAQGHRGNSVVRVQHHPDPVIERVIGILMHALRDMLAGRRVGRHRLREQNIDGENTNE